MPQKQRVQKRERLELNMAHLHGRQIAQNISNIATAEIAYDGILRFRGGDADT